MDGWMD